MLSTALQPETSIASLTTKKVCEESKVTGGVLFRHFSTKEEMLSYWVKRRETQLHNFMLSMPAGRHGLLYFIRELLCNQDLLGFIYLRLSLEMNRQRFWGELYTRINLLPCRPYNVSVECLTDNLFQFVCRAWYDRGPHGSEKIAKTMYQLPWEKIDAGEPVKT